MKKAAIRLMPVQLVTPSHEQTPINTLFQKKYPTVQLKHGSIDDYTSLFW